MIRLTSSVLLALITIVHVAHADKAKARALTETATKKYNLGEYSEAADAFKAAYDEYPDATLLYNLAQCERQLSHKRRAITLYRSYLRESPGAANADEVRRLIAALEQEVSLDDEAKSRREQPAQTATTTTPSVSTRPESPQSVTHVETRRWWSNRAGWTVLGVGVATAAIGGGLLGAAASAQNSAPSAATLADARAQLDHATTFRTTGFALIGVGAGAVVAGALVLALTRSRRRSHASLLPLLCESMLAIGNVQ